MKLLRIIIFSLVFFTGCENEKADAPLETINGTATYYGSFFHGKTTKSGEKFDMNSLTAAHPTFPMGTKVKVINMKNEKSVIIEINDRPRTKAKSRIDLSKAAFQKISDLDSGKIKVKMEVLEWGGDSIKN